MKTKNLLLVSVASLALIVSGCTPTNNNQGSGGGNTPVVVDNEYNIVVNAPSGVTYTVNKEKAKRGEDISLVITGVASGLNIKDVRLNNVALTAESDGRTYNFKMPNRSASIVIRVSVTGDIVVDGDFAAAFTETSAGSGIWKANVSVPSAFGSGLWQIQAKVY